MYWLAARLNGSPIKWSMPLPLMATVETQMVRKKSWRESYKNDGSSTAGQFGDNWSEPCEIQGHIETEGQAWRVPTSQKNRCRCSTWKSCPQRSNIYITKEIKIPKKSFMFFGQMSIKDLPFSCKIVWYFFLDLSFSCKVISSLLLLLGKWIETVALITNQLTWNIFPIGGCQSFVFMPNRMWCRHKNTKK